jgi:hypothetical protein
VWTGLFYLCTAVPSLFSRGYRFRRRRLFIYVAKLQPLQPRVEVQPLEWQDDPILPTLNKPRLTLLACDVLYNVNSHQVLLSTILAFFRAKRKQVQCFIAYKRRTEGDDRFFTMAREQGLQVDCLVELGFAGVEIWRLSKGRLFESAQGQ